MERQAERNHAAEYQEKSREAEEYHRRARTSLSVPAPQLARKLQKAIAEKEDRR